MELQHLSEQLMARINLHLGRVTVTRLRFVQDLAPAAEPAAARVSPAARRAGETAARAAAAGVEDADLREALERLGRAVLAPSPR
jgi:hypothetical protein